MEYANEKARNLVEAFFHESDQKLLEKMRAEVDVKLKKEALAEASGISHAPALDALIHLGVEPDAVAALGLVPLVYVAWADKQLDPAERDAILKAVQEAGFAEDSSSYTLVNDWLKTEPEANLIDAWKAYVTGICQQLDEEGKAALKQDILKRAQGVAEAAGGFLGLGNKVSATERAALDELAAAFD